MKKCYVCEEELTNKNESIEHIFINAIWWKKLKSKDLLCGSCNSILGEITDIELANQLNNIWNLLCIERERWDFKDIKCKSETWKECLIKNGTPYLAHKIISPNNWEINAVVNDEKEAEELINTYKKRYWIKWNINKGCGTEWTFVFSSSFLDKDVFPSIVKTAINFFIFKNWNRKYIKHLIGYILNKEDLDIVNIHYPDKEIYKPLENEVSHIIKIIWNPKEKILYAYIEFFNIYNYIVKLNENYDWENIDETCIFDLLEWKKIDKEIKLDYTKNELLNIILDKNIYSNKLNFQERINRLNNLKVLKDKNTSLFYKLSDNDLNWFTKELTKESISEYLKNNKCSEKTEMHYEILSRLLKSLD